MSRSGAAVSAGGAGGAAVLVDGVSVNEIDFLSETTPAVVSRTKAEPVPVSIGGARMLGKPLPGSTDTAVMTRVPFTFPTDVTDLRVMLSNMGVDTPTPSNTITVSCAIEAAHAAATGVGAGSTITPFRFSGGAYTFTINPGDAVISLPLGLYALIGSASYWNSTGTSAVTWYLRTYVTCAPGGTIPMSFTGDVTLAGAGLERGDSGTVTDKTQSGTVAAWSVARGYIPFALLGRTRTHTLGVGIIGDSVANGTGDANMSSYLHKACTSALVPWVDFSTGGTTSLTWGGSHGQTHEALRKIIGGLDVLLCEHGTNDVGAGGTDVPSLKRQFLNAYWRQTAIHGIPLVQMTVVPRTTGTYATVAGQTPVAGTPNRVAFNQWLRDGAPCTWDGSQYVAAAVGSSDAGTMRCDVYDKTGVKTATGTGNHPLLAVVDTASAVEVNSSGTPTVDGGYWAAARASDGIHPNTQGHTDMSVPAAAVLTTLKATLA